MLLLDCLSFLTETDAKVRPAGRSGTLEDASAPREEDEDVLEETNMLLSVLEGFLMVLSTEGDVIFLSENVSQHMGLTQVQHPHTRVLNDTRVCVFVRRDVWSWLTLLCSSRPS